MFRRLDYWVHQHETAFCVFLTGLAILWPGNSQLVYPHILYLLLLLLGLNLSAGFALQRWPGRKWVSALIICANNATITAILAYSGGRESHLWVLYLLPIYSACLLLRGREVAWVTAGAISFNAVYFLLSVKAWDADAYFELLLKSGIFVFFAAITYRIGQKERKQSRKLRQVEIDLVYAHRRMDDILGNLQAVLWESRCLENFHRLFFISPNVEQITGYPAEQWRDDPNFWLAIMPSEDRKRVEEEASRILAGGQQGSLQFRWRTKEGGEKWMEAHIAVIRDPEGLPTGLRGLILDVSPRRKAEEALRRSEERLRLAQKMEAIGRLAGGIAHDFNNLLTGIQGFAHFILETTPRQDPRHRDAQEIKSAADRAAALTQQLLAFSRRQTLQPRVLDLNAVVEDMERILRRLIRENVSFKVSLERRLHLVKVDSGQIGQVIMNLVVNARDAMPEGGAIRIETANHVLAEPETYSNFSIPPGPYVVLSISDTGMGMDAETLSRIFEPFFTTKELGKGTGLGLSTVYGIVKQSGGYILVSSEPGEGTAFRIYLPPTREPIDPAPRERDDMPLAGGTETILLAEDEKQVRDLTWRILTAYGYQVLAAANGEEALRLAQRHPGPVHILVTDVVMPGFSGPELWRRLSRARPGAKVIFISGFTDQTLLEHSVIRNNLPFLPKPFTPEIILRKVREILDSPDEASPLPMEQVFASRPTDRL